MIRVPSLLTKPLIITVTGGLLTCLVYEVYQKVNKTNQPTNQFYEKPTLKGYTFSKEVLNSSISKDDIERKQEKVTEKKEESVIAKSDDVFSGKGKSRDKLVEDVLQIGWGIKERQRLQRQRQEQQQKQEEQEQKQKK